MSWIQEIAACRKTCRIETSLNTDMLVGPIAEFSNRPFSESCSFSGRRSTHWVAKEAAAVARFRGTISASVDESGKDDLSR